MTLLVSSPNGLFFSYKVHYVAMAKLTRLLKTFFWPILQSKRMCLERDNSALACCQGNQTLACALTCALNSPVVK